MSPRAEPRAPRTRPKLPPALPAGIAELLSHDRSAGCWNSDPNLRPTAAEVARLSSSHNAAALLWPPRARFAG